MLNEKFSKEEVELAINQMCQDKAPSSDRFQLCFFQNCCQTIGMEVTEALEVARRSGRFLKEINNTFIVLIHVDT